MSMTEPTVMDRLARWTHAQSARCAIDTPDRQWSYRQFDEQTGRMASALASGGIGPGDRVGLLFEDEASGVVGLFGVLRSGACAVPLRVSDPSERQRQVALDARLQMAVVGEKDAVAARQLGVASVSLDALVARGDRRPLPASDAGRPAMILYTSGTTGRPKGAVHSHRMLLQKYLRLNNLLQVTADDRVPLFGTFAMAQGINPILGSLLSGGTLCPFDVRREGLERITAWMADGRITTWDSSATLLRNVMRAVGDNRQFPRLRVLRIGGERVFPADIAAAERIFPAARLYVMYGATETGGICVHAVRRGHGYPTGIVPVGRVLDGMSVRILDDDGRECPSGDEGEIAVGGDIAHGYWGDPDLTASQFVQSVDRPGETLYKTGDIGRWTESGELEHRGRKDRRVKVRGFRIELEEVETALSQQVDVVCAAVEARPGPDGDPRLVAYVQPVPDSGLTVEGLRAELAVRLPEHMIPRVFLFLDRLPQTKGGKIARQHLPDPPPERPTLGTEYVDPRNALEAAVAALWCEVLGVQKVGVHDEFLALGGDSLKATMIVARLSSRLGLNVPLSTLFEASTIARLSSAIASRRGR